MTIYRRAPQGVAFKMLVGMYPHGTDPSRAGGVPLKLRDTVTVGPVMQENAGNINARMVAALAGPSPATGVITVANNDFTTGNSEIYLGDYRLWAGLDFAVGGGVNATATNLAAAINRLPGFAAPAPGAADVTVSYLGGPADKVEFRAVHYGTITNFTLAPTTSQMATGNPTIGAPLLT